MYKIGVDLGGTKIAIGVVDENLKIIHKSAIKTNKGNSGNQIIKDIVSEIENQFKILNCDICSIQSIGIGCPGTCDFENGIIEYACNLDLENFGIKKEFQKYINIPIYVDNDANCAAFGENLAGACKNYADSIMVTIGTGVGGGVILNNNIFRGSFNNGTEVGHHVIVSNGKKCNCGRQGCWEVYASASALVDNAKDIASKNQQSKLSTIVDNKFDNIDGKVIFQAFLEKDEPTKKMLDQYLEYLCIGIANLINIFDPQILAIGGGISQQLTKFLDSIISIVEKKVYSRKLNTKIVIAQLGNDAGIIGASQLDILI